MSEVRCGLGGLPPVCGDAIGRLGVGSSLHVEAVSLAGLVDQARRQRVK